MILFARLISYVFHPLILPVAGLLIVFNLEFYVAWALTFQAKMIITSIVFIFTFLLPALNVLFLYKKGIINTLQMDSQKERILPLFLAVISYGILYYFIRKSNLPFIIDRMVLGGVMSVALCFIITFFWKISLHMAGVGALLGMLIAVSYRIGIDLADYVIIVSLCAGLTGFARLQTSSHSSLQVYAGFLAGMGCEIGGFYI